MGRTNGKLPKLVYWLEKKVEIPFNCSLTGKFGLGVWNEAGQRVIEFCQENTLASTFFQQANTFFQQHRRRLYTWTSPDGQHRNQTDYTLCSQRWRSSILAMTVCYEGYNSEPAKWRHTKDIVWEGSEHSTSITSPCRIRVSHSLGKSVCSPTRKLNWDLMSRIFTVVSLCEHDWLNH